jgi:hypothetical protein
MKIQVDCDTRARHRKDELHGMLDSKRLPSGTIVTQQVQRAIEATVKYFYSSHRGIE